MQVAVVATRNPTNVPSFAPTRDPVHTPTPPPTHGPVPAPTKSPVVPTPPAGATDDAAEDGGGGGADAASLGIIIGGAAAGLLLLGMCALAINKGFFSPAHSKVKDVDFYVDEEIDAKGAQMTRFPRG
jgi:hypothetical protein